MQYVCQSDVEYGNWKKTGLNIAPNRVGDIHDDEKEKETKT